MIKIEMMPPCSDTGRVFWNYSTASTKSYDATFITSRASPGRSRLNDKSSDVIFSMPDMAGLISVGGFYTISHTHFRSSRGRVQAPAGQQMPGPRTPGFVGTHTTCVRANVGAKAGPKEKLRSENCRLVDGMRLLTTTLFSIAVA